MRVTTLVVGFNPSTDKIILKPTQKKELEYLSDVFAKCKMGKVSFCDYPDSLQKLDDVNPILVITFNNIHAEKVKEHKADCFVYVLSSYRQIVRNKTEEEELSKYAEIEKLVESLEEKNDNESVMRKIASMGYRETYKMIKEMLVIGNDELVRKAWEMLNLNHGDWPWMRANLIMDCWKGSDAKRKEEFVMIGVKRWLDAGYAAQIEDLVVGENVLRQYKLNDGTIYRVPVAREGMGEYAFEDLINKYNEPEIVSN